jgi:hypothetical protein
MTSSISTCIVRYSSLAWAACSMLPAVAQQPPIAAPASATVIRSSENQSPQIAVRPTPTAAEQSSQPLSSGTTPIVDPRLIEGCSHIPYDPYKSPPPDAVQEVFDHKKYRLVIGVGENQFDQSANRDYVDNTAKLVDEKLEKLNYAPLPSFAKSSALPYLAGKNATKEAIMKALVEMQHEMGQGDIGVIYYVGHGGVTPSNRDVILSVYDRPIANDEGIRVDDILGTLELNRTRSAIHEVPNYFIVLDSCLSGNAAQGNRTVLVDDGGIQRIESIEGRIVPEQVAILTSTASGRDPEAYQLAGTAVSAFGFFFARALDEDWDCVDRPQPDGILTLDEISDYLEKKLELAYSLKATPAKMSPTLLEKDKKEFLAYNAERRSLDGARAKIKKMNVKSKDPAFAAEVRFSTGESLRCAEPTGCSFLVSESLIRNSSAILQQTEMTNVEIVSRWNDLNTLLGSFTPLKIAYTKIPPTKATNDIQPSDHGDYVAWAISRESLSTYVASLDNGSPQEPSTTTEGGLLLRTNAEIGKPSVTSSKKLQNSAAYEEEAKKDATDRLEYYYSLANKMDPPKAPISKAQWKKSGGLGDYSDYQRALKDAGEQISEISQATTTAPTLIAGYNLAISEADGPVTISDVSTHTVTRSEATSQNLKDLLNGKTIEAGGVILAIQ